MLPCKPRAAASHYRKVDCLCLIVSKCGEKLVMITLTTALIRENPTDSILNIPNCQALRIHGLSLSVSEISERFPSFTCCFIFCQLLFFSHFSLLLSYNLFKTASYQTQSQEPDTWRCNQHSTLRIHLPSLSAYHSFYGPALFCLLFACLISLHPWECVGVAARCGVSVPSSSQLCLDKCMPVTEIFTAVNDTSLCQFAFSLSESESEAGFMTGVEQIKRTKNKSSVL